MTGKTVRVKAQTFEEWKKERLAQQDAYDIIDVYKRQEMMYGGGGRN